MAAPARGRRGAGVSGDRAAQRDRLRHAPARGAQQRPQGRDQERDDRRGDALRGRAGARGGEAAEAGSGGDRACDRGAPAAGDQANRRCRGAAMNKLPWKPGQTNPELLRLLEEARNHVMTPAEIYEQRISFVYGNLSIENDKITKGMVRKWVEETYGPPPTGDR